MLKKPLTLDSLTSPSFTAHSADGLNSFYDCFYTYKTFSLVGAEVWSSSPFPLGISTPSTWVFGVVRVLRRSAGVTTGGWCMSSQMWACCIYWPPFWRALHNWCCSCASSYRHTSCRLCKVTHTLSLSLSLSHTHTHTHTHTHSFRWQLFHPHHLIMLHSFTSPSVKLLFLQLQQIKQIAIIIQ